jgi:H+/Cl- antiporter ClcA
LHPKRDLARAPVPGGIFAPSLAIGGGIAFAFSA